MSLQVSDRVEGFKLGETAGDKVEKNRMSKHLLVFLAALAISGCASNPDDGTTSGIDQGDAATEQADSELGYYDEGEAVDSSYLDQNDQSDAQLRSSNVFYFDYDLAELKAEAFEPLKAHARYLIANRDLMVRLEGHCDERGTREYNIALGERRAEAVAKFLRVQGVSSSQMEVVSYGEERPASFGHTEESWAQNRRVELFY